MSPQPIGLQQSIRFGEEFELDLCPTRLRRGNHVLRLERIPLEILILPLECRGEIVSRKEIVARVWGMMFFWIRTTASGVQSARSARFLGTTPKPRDLSRP
jgi:DNA-binding winged helix-turn-helix (wHTH) protein